MSKYCPNCGAELEENTKFCSKCGAQISPNTNQPNYNQNQYNQSQGKKSKIAAGILGIFLGSLGVHNFYLGYTGKAVAQLLLTLVGWIACGIGPIVAGIWGLVEGILILTGSINTDAEGNPLSD